MEFLKILNTVDAVNMLSGNYMEVISKYLAVAAMPILVIALINCFFGQKLFKILVGIAGIFIGAGLGAGISVGFNLLVKKDMPNTSMIIVSVILGILIFGFISFKLYKAGAFCMGFLSGVVLGISVMKLLNKDDYVIAAVIGGLLMGLLAIDLYKHMVIILTSVNGGLIGAACIAIITKNYDPIFLLKLGTGLAIGGIIFQYILTLFGKKKHKDEEDDEDEETDEKQEKRKKAVKQVAKTKQKKNTTKRLKVDEKQTRIKANKNTNNNTSKNANKKTSAVKKKEENNGAGFFLIDIIIAVSQGIKDRVVRYLNADDIEDDEEYDNEYDNDEYNEDEDDEEIDEIDADEDEEDDDEYEDEEYEEKEEINDPFQDMELMLTRNLEENINIPLFDVDDIGAKLEEELENNLKNQRDEELEELIIKQTIKDIDL